MTNYKKKVKTILNFAKYKGYKIPKKIYIPEIIFDSNFAKIIFGEKKINVTADLKDQGVKPLLIPSWIKHLGEAIRSELPIEYYYKYVKKINDQKIS